MGDGWEPWEHLTGSAYAWAGWGPGTKGSREHMGSEGGESHLLAVPRNADMVTPLGTVLTLALSSGVEVVCRRWVVGQVCARK